MRNHEQVDLIRRCLALLREGRTEISEGEASSPVERYFDEARYGREMSAIFARMPLVAAHSSELAEAGGYLARDWLGGFPLLLTRDKTGEVRAFANVCRHRGARLVAPGKGCAGRLVCPYHAWTYGLDGSLRGVPHRTAGFPSLDVDATRLKQLHCTEAHGFVWVTMEDGGPRSIEAHLAGLEADLSWMKAGAHELFAEEVREWGLNWKIVLEGALESYHFKVAHKDTIAPMFNDNLAVHDGFGPHVRSFLTKATLRDVEATPERDWNIRELGNLLYTLYPNCFVLLQPDHFALVEALPIAAARTRISLRTFVPRGETATAKARSHWQRNHALTVATLYEDFEIGERIQEGIRSGANDAFRFGRFEQALARFHATTEALLRPR